jgi:hypothetical protein
MCKPKILFLMRELETSRYKFCYIRLATPFIFFLLKLCEIIMSFYRTQFSCVTMDYHDVMFALLGFGYL